MTGDGITRDSADSTTTERALAGSRVATAARGVTLRLRTLVQRSFLYRWLTAEPDPDVIVIDLRQTWTVGPFLRVLDRVVDVLADAATGSRAVALGREGARTLHDGPLRVAGLAVAALGLVVAVTGLPGGVSTTTVAVGLVLAVVGLVAARDDRDWATLRETRPVTLAIAAFEPPEPLTRGEEGEGREDEAHRNGEGDEGDGQRETSDGDGSNDRTHDRR